MDQKNLCIPLNNISNTCIIGYGVIHERILMKVENIGKHSVNKDGFDKVIFAVYESKKRTIKTSKIFYIMISGQEFFIQTEFFFSVASDF